MTSTATPAQRFATILEGLKKVVAAANAQKMPGAWILLIWNKINRISQYVTRIATLVQEGKYHPRQSSGKPRKPTTNIRKPRQRQLSYRKGWLLRALPMRPGWQGAAPWRGFLETLLQDPEMVALIAAAPTLVRPIRSLCFMLLIPPPPILALAKRPTPPGPIPPQAAAAAAPTASAPPDPPTQAAPAPSPIAVSPNPPPANACGPP